MSRLPGEGDLRPTVVFYNPIMSYFLIIEPWVTPVKKHIHYERHQFVLGSWYCKGASVLSSYDEAVKAYRDTGIWMDIGVVTPGNHFFFHGTKVNAAGRRYVMALLEAAQEQLKEKGPVKVKEYTYIFTQKMGKDIHARINVRAYVGYQKLIKKAPKLKKLKRARTDVYEYWIPRVKYRPEMKIVKYAK